MKQYQSDYAQKLKDPRWQRKRLEILNRDFFACMRCFSETKTLHVHHRLYNKSAEPWDYDNDVLVTLCEDCHQEEGEKMALSIERLAREFKRLFFSEEIDMVTEGLKQYQHVHLTKISAEVVSSLFSKREYAEKELKATLWYEGKDKLHQMPDPF